MIVFSGGKGPRIASAVTDLPEPDSPTSAIVAFFGMSNEMPFTASNVWCLSRRNVTRRSRMRTSGSRAISAESISVPPGRLKELTRPLWGQRAQRAWGSFHVSPAGPPQGTDCAPSGGSERSERGGRSSVACPALEFRVEGVAQRIGEEAEGRHERGHRDGRGDQLPPLAEDQVVLRLIQHRAPRYAIDRN